MLGRAQELVPPGSFDQAAEVIRDAVEATATRLRADLGAVFQVAADAGEPEASLRSALRFAYDTFEAYDLPLYLIGYGTPVGETNPVEIVRVSPQEARGPVGVTRELRGLRLHHFGAFLDEKWRAYDMAWGRLDGAECLIRALLPKEDPRADKLVWAAHRQILEEYRAEVHGPASCDVFEWFRAHQVAEDPEPEATTKALNRGAVVMSHMVEDALRQRGAGGGIRNVVKGIRDSLTSGYDAPAIDAVLGLARSNTWFVGAVFLWEFLLAVGVVLLFLGDGPRLAGGVLLGALGGVGLVALAARLVVGHGVRKALAAARRAAYATFFPGQQGKQGEGRSARSRGGVP